MPRRRFWRAGVALAVLGVFATGLVGCGSSSDEITRIPSSTVDAVTVESTMEAMATPSVPTPQTPMTSTPTQTVAPLTPVPPPVPTVAPPTPDALPLPPPTQVPPPVPTVAPPTPVATPPPPTAVPTTSGFVLEHPDIPPGIEERILEGEYIPINVLFPDEQVSEQEPFVNKISCDEPASIAYMQDLTDQTIPSKESDFDNATLDSIGRHS